MVLFDRKKALSAIMGPANKGEEEVSSLSTCMQEFIEAVQSSDVEGAVASFRACFSQLNSEQPEEPKA